MARKKRRSKRGSGARRGGGGGRKAGRKKKGRKKSQQQSDVPKITGTVGGGDFGGADIGQSARQRANQDIAVRGKRGSGSIIGTQREIAGTQIADAATAPQV